MRTGSEPVFLPVIEFPILRTRPWVVPTKRMSWLRPSTLRTPEKKTAMIDHQPSDVFVCRNFTMGGNRAGGGRQGVWGRWGEGGLLPKGYCPWKSKKHSKFQKDIQTSKKDPKMTQYEKQGCKQMYPFCMVKVLEIRVLILVHFGPTLREQ